MALFWSPKPSAATMSFDWTPELADGVTVAITTATMTNATLVSRKSDSQTVTFTISGGTSGQTASLAIVATTSDGQTLSETIYLPIIGPGVLAETVQDIVAFALRKVTGIGETPDADQAADALERLQDMLDYWRLTGADVGAPSPLALTSVVYCPDGYLLAIKYNLILQLADFYGFDVSPVVVQNAAAGLAMVKAHNLPEDRPGVFF